MKNAIKYLLFFIFLIHNFYTKSQQKNNSLKDLYAKDFLIGAAINANQIGEKDSLAAHIITTHFNTITPENILKSAIIHPKWDQYNFELADKYVALGKKNKMFVVGHTLLWHSQLSPFITKNTSADSVKLFLENHIKTIVGRYAGQINGWDVVNEAIEEDGSLRKTIFLNKLGENYIIDAFKLAEKADPKAELYYNDFIPIFCHGK